MFTENEVIDARIKWAKTLSKEQSEFWLDFYKRFWPTKEGAERMAAILEQSKHKFFPMFAEITQERKDSWPGHLKW